MNLKQRKEEALALLSDSISIIYGIQGDRWQMAYEVLESVLANLQYEPNIEPTTVEEIENA